MKTPSEQETKTQSTTPRDQFEPDIPVVAAIVPPPEQRCSDLLGETDTLIVEPVVSVAETAEDQTILKTERGKRLTRQLLRTLRANHPGNLSVRDVAERRGVYPNAIQRLENQDIATIKVGTLIEQLHALDHTDVTESVLVKLILDFIENPEERRVESLY